MRKLLIATKNKGKSAELHAFLADLPVTCVSLDDVFITDDIYENGKTYQENSQRKALFYAKKSGLPTIADDGGLEIDALGGAPGVKSRRWLGYKASDEELIAHMQKVAQELPWDNRRASFVTVVSFALPTGEVWSQEGRIEGIIAKKPHMRLLHGYPYRSFFYLPEIQKYYHESELPRKEMERYNHRFLAVKKLKKIIREKLTP